VRSTKTRDKARERYRKNAEKMREKCREYYKKNTGRIAETQRKWKILHPERCKELQKRWAIENPHRCWAWATISQHRHRGYIVDIDIEELSYIAQHTTSCPYCGSKLDWSRGGGPGGHKSSPTLDRRENEKVLFTKNIQIICMVCNRKKGDWPEDLFIERMRREGLLNRRIE